MFFKKSIKNEKFLRNSSSIDFQKPKILQITNIFGRFLEKEKILIDPHGLNMLNTIKKDGDVYFGEKLLDVI